MTWKVKQTSTSQKVPYVFSAALLTTHHLPYVYTSTTCNINGCNLIAKYIQPTLTLLSGLVGIVAVISLISAGIMHATSEGDPQKSGKARARIVNTLMALVAYFFLYAFLQFLIPNGLFH